MNSTITVSGIPFNFSVNPFEREVPQPSDIGVNAPNCRWMGSKVRLQPRIVEMMQATSRESAYSWLTNPHTKTGELPLTLLTDIPPSSDDTYMVTGIRTADLGTTYDLYSLATPEERRIQVRVFELSLAVRPGLPYQYDSKTPNHFNLVAPTNTIDVVSLALEGEPMPVPGVDFVAPTWMVLRDKFHKLDLRCDGFSNRTTALLAKALSRDSSIQKELDALRNNDGVIRGVRLVHASFANAWEKRFLNEADYLVEGFPPTFRLSVNYTELAEFLSEALVS